MSEPTNDTVAIVRMQMQLEHVIGSLDEIKAGLKTDIADLRQRVSALERERIQREAEMKAAVRTGKLFWSAIVVVSGLAWSAVQVAAKHLGWF